MRASAARRTSPGGALNAAEVKAIASGNPEVMEKVRVDAEIRKLDQLRSAHASTVLRIRRELAQLPSQIKAGHAQLERNTSDIAARDEARKAGDEFSIKVLGKTIDGEGARAKADEALSKALDERIGFPTPTTVGEYLGFKLRAKGYEELKSVAQWMEGPSGEHYSWNLNVASAEANIRGLESVLQRNQREVEANEKKLTDFQAQVKKPFEHDARIQELVAKQKGLDASLDLDKSEDQVGAEGEEGGAGGGAPPTDRPGAPAGAEEEPPDSPEGLRGAAARARERIRGRGKTQANDLGAAAAQGAGTFGDLGIIGADWIGQGFRNFGTWARKMLADLGDVVQNLARHLRRVWQDARQVWKGAQGKRRQATPRAEAPPRTPPPPPRRPGAAAGGAARGPQVEPTVTERLRATAGRATERARKILERFEALDEKFRTAQEHAERVADRGTIPKEERAGFRRAGQPTREQTKGFRFSEEDIEQAGAEMVDAVREFERARIEFERNADPISAESMRQAERVMKDAVKAWQVYRSAAGRAVHRFNEPIPANVIQRLREAGVLSDGARFAKERVPLATNIVDSLRRWSELTDAEKKQFGRDLVDHFRLNLFSVSSWTLDLIGNASEFVGQLAGGAARDLVHVATTGNVSFPSMQGLMRAIRYRIEHRLETLPPELEKELGRTVSGEKIGTEGKAKGEWFVPPQKTFTSREGVGPEGSFTRKATRLGSTLYDYIVGGPLYAKGVMDTAAKRLAATWQIWRDAIEEADRKGLTGADRQAFYDRFMADIPEATVKRAVERGRKAGFDRELSKLEEKVASSTTARLLVDSFARWPFQFTRWAGEMLGYNRPLWGKMIRGEASAGDIAEYLGKTATGWGALYMLNNLYDRTDFNSMEYVDKDGNRIRLSNRDPIPSAMWFLAVLRGDLDRAAAGLRFASVPGGRLLSGEGGLLGSTVQAFLQATENPTNTQRALKRQFEDILNRALPGQAVLSALKTVFDPTIREGLGANVPGVSALLPGAVEPTTGKAHAAAAAHPRRGPPVHLRRADPGRDPDPGPRPQAALPVRAPGLPGTPPAGGRLSAREDAGGARARLAGAVRLLPQPSARQLCRGHGAPRQARPRARPQGDRGPGRAGGQVRHAAPLVA
jgi:hypothetical protein